MMSRLKWGFGYVLNLNFYFEYYLNRFELKWNINFYPFNVFSLKIVPIKSLEGQLPVNMLQVFLFYLNL